MRKPEIDKRLKDAYEQIGDKIVKLRGRMNQNDLAKKAKVSRATISAIEQGKAISLKNLIKIADGLDVFLEELFVSNPFSVTLPFTINRDNLEALKQLVKMFEEVMESHKDRK